MQKIVAFFRKIIAWLVALFAGAGVIPAAEPPANEVAAYDPAQADCAYYIDANETLYDVSDLLYGVFFEDINFAADGGLYAEKVSNRSFEFTELARDDGLFGWSAVRDAVITVADSDGLNVNNTHYAVVTNDSDREGGLENRGFMEGMSVEKDAEYRVSFWAKGLDGYSGPVTAQLVVGTGVFAQAKIDAISDVWTQYTLTIRSQVTAVENVRLRLLIERGKAAFDMISMFPTETFMGRENGVRADLGQLLADMKPKFLRFPGGCVTEGIDYETQYHWKDSIGVDADGAPLRFNGTYGDVAARSQGIDLWTDLGAHDDPYPSFMSYGLGFYEFFQLCEDLGASPVPVVNAGLYCQMRGRHGVDMNSEEFRRDVQDLLDLVEFARGSADSVWGGVRAAMGHPAPFDLQYVCVGNENENEEFYERYTAFLEAFLAAKEADPQTFDGVELIYSAGAADATHSANYTKSYAYAQSWLAAHDETDVTVFAGATDQHYYNSPDWFRKNTDYYDAANYRRTVDEMTETPYGGAIPVFVGEYAAQSNTLEAALAEAAYMTGLERNGDIVRMAAYAPLFGNVTAGHWQPDLIWLDQTDAKGSVNYEVQKAFSVNQSKTLVSSALDGALYPKSDLSGRVGVGTWYTAAAFDNVVVTDRETGKTLGKDSFTGVGLPLRWDRPTDGKFRLQDGRLVQSETDMRYTDTGSVAYFGKTEWSNYTYELDAEKLDGQEGFMISFAARDIGNNFIWNIGGWNNTVSCLQEISGNAKSGQLPGTVRPFAVETGRTYHLKIELDGCRIRCYIDGELYVDYTAGSNADAAVYQTAGLDANGDLIVKLVNVTDRNQTLGVQISGRDGFAQEARVTQISGSDPKSVNRLGAQDECAVNEFDLAMAGDAFNYTLPKYSVTVLKFSKK